MAPNTKDGLQQRLELWLWNSDGNPNKKVLFNRMINNPTNKTKIYIINDCRLIKGEETSIRARYHNVEISNDNNNKHLPGGVALLTPKGAFVDTHTDGDKEQILATIDYQGQRIHIATQYCHKGGKIDEQMVE